MGSRPPPDMGFGMVALEDIQPGSRLRSLDPEGVAEVVQVA